MRNSNGGRDNRKSNRDQYRKPDYAGEMLFDDEEDYDDDACLLYTSDAADE